MTTHYWQINLNLFSVFVIVDGDILRASDGVSSRVYVPR